MKPSSRTLAVTFTLSLSLLATILLWPDIINQVITSISLVLWLLLRIFILSIGQKYYWSAIILVLLVFLFRLFPRERNAEVEEKIPDSNSTIKTVEYWRSLFTLANNDLRDSKAVKGELTHLLLLLYATRQSTAADFRLHDALQQGEIPLPEDIHTFLFPKEEQVVQSPFEKRMKSLWKTPQKWIRRWTGQETAEYNRMIDKVLGFMETSLEIKNDDRNTGPHKH